MQPDYGRLARAIVTARKARGWTKQKDFVVASGLGNSTVQRLERGAEESPYPTRSTIDALERALDWERGSVARVLAGGEPTPLSASEHTRAGDGAGGAPDVRGLSPEIRWALAEGETLAGDVIELTRPGSKLRLIVVVQRGIYNTDEDRERLRLEMEEWLRIKQGIGDVVRGEGNAGAPRDVS